MQRIEEELRPVDQRQNPGAVRIERIHEDGSGSSQGRRIEIEIRRLEDDVHRSADSRVAPGQLGERVALELLNQVDAVQTLQVVEAVAVLQELQLRLEDVVERRPEQTAEDGLLLGHTAGPEVDIVETAGRRRSEQDGVARVN